MSGGRRSEDQGSVYRRTGSDKDRLTLIRYLRADAKLLNPIDAQENHERARFLEGRGGILEVHKVFFTRRGERAYAFRDQYGRFSTSQ